MKHLFELRRGNFAGVNIQVSSSVMNASVGFFGLIIAFTATMAVADNGVNMTVNGKTEHNIIVEMHKMANNYIIADEVWGKEEMTKPQIQVLKTELAHLDTVNRGTLADL